MDRTDRYGQKWSRDETILAFELYCMVPFGSIDKRNPQIIELAELLGRSPSSVGLKLSNLAHYDPKLQERNISGMSHASRLDREIFEEFAVNMEELSIQAGKIKAKITGSPVVDDLADIDFDNIPEGRDREASVKQRVGQYYFRLAVLNNYKNRCCITGLSQKDLLIASHIKPWNVSDVATERTNPCNGLCLNALHDKAFDKGLITIDKAYKIIVSNKIKGAMMDDNTYDWFMGYDKKEIQLPTKFTPGELFIEYHNDVIFQH